MSIKTIIARTVTWMFMISIALAVVNTITDIVNEARTDNAHFIAVVIIIAIMAAIVWLVGWAIDNY